ncbi:MAG: hypothetical protein J6I53_12485 [Treponema sp.]|nr:hypothetical protein [Treponema sp.]
MKCAFLSGVLKLQTNQNKSHNHGGHTGYTQPSFSGNAVSGWVDMNNNVNSGSPLGGAGGVFSVSGESKINLDSGTWNTRGSRLIFSMTPSGTVQNHAHNITADGGTEARPDNYTVRIWKRIA